MTTTAATADRQLIAAVRHLKTRLDDALAGNYWGDDIAELCDLGEQLGQAVRAAKLRRQGTPTTDHPADLDAIRRALTHYDETGSDDVAHDLVADLPALLAEVERLRGALTLIGVRCANYTAGDCIEDGARTPDAPYSADRWCDQCIARHALIHGWCEWCEQPVLAGQRFTDQPGTGGLLEHTACATPNAA